MSEAFDIAVVGAGPAGALAAREAARLGARVLLVDKAPFPRAKVCGCCLNARAVRVLERVGLGHTLAGAAELRQLQLSSGGRCASLPLPRGLALSRATLDARLADAAVEAGATFVDGAAASLIHLAPGRHRLALRGRGEISARVVLAADGLGGRLLGRVPGFENVTKPDARIGCGCVLTPGCGPDPGTIAMAVGAGGYVGAVRLEDGTIDVAAAVDVAAAQRSGGPAGLAAALARDAGWPWAGRLRDADWRGTPRLTRSRRCLARDGLFVLGDAAGYVEPFTGEGIAWALAGGEAVADLAVQAARTWEPHLATRWSRRHRELIRRRQLTCRAVAWALRRPRLVRTTTALFSLQPRLAEPVLRRMTRTPEAVS